MIYFPHPLLCDEEGLLAVGGDLSSARLRLAYNFGIFPWYNQEPILWWYTHPRCVLYPSEIRITKSMKSLIRKKRPWTITVNKDFENVIKLCGKTERMDQHGTWITDDMTKAYINFHKEGFAHSVEVWENEDLVGGLYGILIGKIFYGESMFSLKSNSSKYALIHLARYLESLGCTVIDCQQDTPHMRSMGATLITKDVFWNIVKNNTLAQPISFSETSFQDWLELSFQ